LINAATLENFFPEENSGAVLILLLVVAGRDQQLAADPGEDAADIDVQHVRHRLAHPRPHVLQRIRRRTLATPGEDRRNAEAAPGRRQSHQVDEQAGVPGDVVGRVVVAVVYVEGRIGTDAAKPPRTLRDYQVQLK